MSNAKQLSNEERAEAVRRWRAMESATVLQQAAQQHYTSYAEALAKKYKVPKAHAVLNLAAGEISRNGKR